MIVKELTGIGKRNTNEDYSGYIFAGDYLCAVVCDGLGGYGSGEVASRLIGETIIDLFNESPTMELSIIRNYIQMAQDKLMALKASNREYAQMMTTLTLVITDRENLIMAHIGDSRILSLHKGKQVDRTEDHSVVGIMIKSGEITEKESLHHPDRNKLLRAVGMGIEISEILEISTVPINHDMKMQLVLCTDGFWENCDTQKLEKMIKKYKNSDKLLIKLDAVIQKSKYFGDNYTAIIIDMESD